VKGGFNMPKTYAVEPSPASIVMVFKNPGATAPTDDSAEIHKLYDDDQAARNFDFSKVTTQQLKDMAEGDQKRMARIVVLLNEGKVRTANDFYWAAFLYQHGTCFDDYHMAHELSVCSMLLGNKEAKWIGAASYDRMLRSGGLAQRWGTQYESPGMTGMRLAKVESDGISDNQRKAVVGRTLEEARNRKME
jgi:hypothetical protein